MGGGHDDRADQRRGPRADRPRFAGRDGDRYDRGPGGPRGGHGRDTESTAEDGPRPAGPQLSDEIRAEELDSTVRAELLSLARPVAETVARHLVAAGRLVDEDPQEALAHALAARRLASRIAVVREAVGLAAYHADEWQTAIAELRTYHRMSGRQTHLAVLADCERALGRADRAVDLYRTADRDSLDPAVAIELLMVAAGARADLGQHDAAVAMLQVRELTGEGEPWSARLRYAYADALLAAGRVPEAREWFARTAAVDTELETDAAERLLELDGVALTEAEEEEEADGPDAADGPDSAGGTAAAPAAAIRAGGNGDTDSEADAGAGLGAIREATVGGDADAASGSDADADTGSGAGRDLSVPVVGGDAGALSADSDVPADRAAGPDLPADRAPDADVPAARAAAPDGAADNAGGPATAPAGGEPGAAAVSGRPGDAAVDAGADDRGAEPAGSAPVTPGDGTGASDGVRDGDTPEPERDR